MMYTLNEEEFILIKNSTNWATRSITKFRSYFDKKYGEHIRNLLLKSINGTSELEEVYDKFVSGTVREKTKTKSDIDALAAFRGVNTYYENFSGYLLTIILPELKKDGIDISLEDINPKEEGGKEDNAKSKVKPEDTNALPAEDINRPSLIEELHKYIVVLGSSIVMPHDLSEPDKDAFQQELNDIERKLSQTLELLRNKDISDHDALLNYTGAKEKWNTFINYYNQLIAKFSSEEYRFLIKTATTIQEISGYYLMSMAGYGKITTPIKEKILAVKNFIGLGINNTIDNLRKDCIGYTKALIKHSEIITDYVEVAAKGKSKQDWVNLIKEYNNFVDNYNSYRQFYIQLYSALKIKTNQDRVLKSKKEKNIDSGSAAMKDFVDYSWTDLPANVSNKFPALKRIGG